MLRLANAILSSGCCTTDEITPFCVEAIYRGAVFYGRGHSRTGNLSDAASCATIKEALNEIGKRWRAASKFLVVMAQSELRADPFSPVCSND